MHKKKEYSLVQLIFSLFSIINSHKRYFAYMITSIILSTAWPFVAILFPRYIIDEIANLQRWNYVVFWICIMGLSMLIIYVASVFVNSKMVQHNEILVQKINLYIGEISMKIDMAQLESSDMSDKIEMAKDSRNSIEAIESIVKIITQAITIIGLVIIISSINILFFIVSIIVLLTKLYSQYKVNVGWAKCRLEAKLYERQGGYLNSYIMDHSGAKEIRMHNFSKWIYDKMLMVNNQSNSIFMKNLRKTLKFEMIAHIVYETQTFFCYFMLTGYALSSQISIGEFIMYLSTITALTSSLDVIVASITNLQKSITYLIDLRFIQKYVKKNRDNRNSTLPLSKSYTIEFKNVSFKYPNSESYVLRNINILIPPNQSVSVVGKNGAGKTTFIKLLCGFYKPTEGQILINNFDLNECCYEQYTNIIGAVFQDFKLFSFSIKDNIIMNKEVNKEKIDNSLKYVELKDRIDELPQGLDTYLFKNFDESGVELSGGQMQKLAFTRALYKDTPIILLDEPVASLDPLSEYEIYKKYKDMSKAETSIFVSHRLASTRFTDVIAVFDNGEIVEYGNHDVLIQSNGIYHEMFMTQAKYYQL